MRRCRKLLGLMQYKFAPYEHNYFRIAGGNYRVVARENYMILVEHLFPNRPPILLLMLEPLEMPDGEIEGMAYIALRTPEDYKHTYHYYLNERAGSAGELE